MILSMTEHATATVEKIFEPQTLDQFLQSEGQTLDDFEHGVMDKLKGLLEYQRGKIGRCLVGIRDNRLQITFVQREVCCDHDLQDACSTWELNRARAGWINMGTFVCPATSNENIEYMHDVAASGED